jgi:TetR/AcrR family transcriptional regulator, copper-responsive repressor
MNAKRGRPRQYDRKVVLESALRLFHEQGYAGTSLDDLATAMGMNRPSIYHAFGNKQALYRSALGHFIEAMTTTSRNALGSSPELSESLIAFYAAVLDVYFAEKPARGCFVFCTAPAEAITHPEIANDLQEVIAQVDRVLEERFAQGQRDAQLSATLNPAVAAAMGQALMHSLALRVRAGASRRSLTRLVKAAVEHWCGTPG